ncbi:hypothetical protein GCM10010330_24830 [Streptomyces tendae]|uniref:hypothetical protein n=1 Tax=Streptomyces tendae TaxID=1932 RepID=UPI0019828D7A|nr:hypothetical protein [Streptomyces tendae]GHA71087.1 hypothetical protein GCM10010330_24830 [Streptomyces tendae]
MITAQRPPCRALRTTHPVATVVLAFLLILATAACSTPTTRQDVPAHAAATQDDPRFEGTFRHEFAEVDASACTT